MIEKIIFIELQNNISISEINGLNNPFNKILVKLNSTKLQHKEAKLISIKRNIPKFDVLHAIIAKESNDIFITRDKHFKELRDLCESKLPESLL